MRVRSRALVALALAPALVLGLAPALPIGAGPAAAAPGEVRTIPSRGGVTESLGLLRPGGAPTASVILLTGGDGVLALTPQGLGRMQGNFLVRSRQRFVQEGFLVAVLDRPSDRTSLWNFRTTSDHAQDLKAAIAAVREIANVPVWLIGTTSKMSGESIQHVSLSKITVPVLIVHHRHDACQSSPYAFATYLPKDLTNAPVKELLTFDGGSPPTSDPCEAQSAHGYLGIEPEVVSAIAAWIRAH
jgi:pimeloyl-ACP methyl ester carboxylesterase